MKTSHLTVNACKVRQRTCCDRLPRFLWSHSDDRSSINPTKQLVFLMSLFLDWLFICYSFTCLFVLASVVFYLNLNTNSPFACFFLVSPRGSPWYHTVYRVTQVMVTPTALVSGLRRWGTPTTGGHRPQTHGRSTPSASRSAPVNVTHCHPLSLTDIHWYLLSPTDTHCQSLSPTVTHWYLLSPNDQYSLSFIVTNCHPLILTINQYHPLSFIVTLSILKMKFLKKKSRCIVSGNSPTFSNLGSTVTFPDSTTANSLMFTVAWTDDDPLDILTVAMTTTTSSFTFNTVSGVYSFFH